MTRRGQTRKGTLDPRKSLATPKFQVKIATWNVSALNQVGKTVQVTTEMRKYAIDILGVSECRWTGFGQLRTVTGETILYSGRDDAIYHGGVALILSKKGAASLIEW